jgi:hypothetical protein
MNTLFLFCMIVQAIFGIGLIFVPALLLSPIGVTPDITSATFARLFGSAILAMPVLLFFARKSDKPEFKKGVAYGIFAYLLASTTILLITQLKGLMNALGWSIIILHLLFIAWFGYYLIKPLFKRI